MFLTLYRNKRFRFFLDQSDYCLRYAGNQVCRSLDAITVGVGTGLTAVFTAEVMAQLLISTNFIEDKNIDRLGYITLFLNCLFTATGYRFSKTGQSYHTTAILNDERRNSLN